VDVPTDEGRYAFLSVSFREGVYVHTTLGLLFVGLSLLPLSFELGVLEKCVNDGPRVV